MKNVKKAYKPITENSNKRLFSTTSFLSVATKRFQLKV